MNTSIALLRGINVGGANALPMKDLVSVLEELGCSNVRTYIQSGNAVFTSPHDDHGRLGERISDAIESRFGFRPHTMVLSLEQIEKAAERNPFPEAVDDPKTLQLYFLGGEAPNPDLDGLAALRANDERFLLDGQVFYLHAPSGIGRSKLAAGVERALGVPVTARNWRSVMKILEMVREG